MSQEQVNTSVRDNTYEAVEELRRAHGYQYRSDAAREALKCGLAELGYLSEGAAITPARRITREVAKLLLFVSGTLLLLSAGSGAEYFAPGLGVLAGSIGVYGVDRWLLRRVEPAVTNRLPRIEVNRRGSAK